jgi:hypothetical protein
METVRSYKTSETQPTCRQYKANMTSHLSGITLQISTVGMFVLNNIRQPASCFQLVMTIKSKTKCRFCAPPSVVINSTKINFLNIFFEGILPHSISSGANGGVAWCPCKLSWKSSQWFKRLKCGNTRGHEATDVFLRYLKLSRQMRNVVLCILMSCNLVGGWQRFGWTYRLHLQGISDNLYGCTAW